MLRLAVRQRNFIRGLVAAVFLAAILVFADLFVLSRSAALIFNHAMANQTMLRGTVTVEKLRANILGEVRFENLEWKDAGGGTILFVPRGSFRARPYDVLTGNLKSTTIQELTLDGAVLSMALDDDMQFDFLRHSPELDAAEEAALKEKERAEKERAKDKNARREDLTEAELKALGEKVRAERTQAMHEHLRNFDREGRKLRLKLDLTNCRGELFYRRCHYLLQGMEIHADINTAEAVAIKGTIVGLGGTMRGNGMTINGAVDMQDPATPVADLSVLVSEVDPSSLGFGMNIRDKMTLSVRFTGPLAAMDGAGTVRLRDLHIPGIAFKNVEGMVHWRDARLDFTDVTADVFGGKLYAYGDYDLDTRYWHLYGHGEGLEAAEGFPNGYLDCKVDLDLVIRSAGSTQRTEYSGSFRSGAGTYRWVLPFVSLSGTFDSAWRDLRFGDLEIDFGDGYRARAATFRRKDGEVTLAPIELYDAEGKRSAFGWKEKW